MHLVWSGLLPESQSITWWQWSLRSQTAPEGALWRDFQQVQYPAPAGVVFQKDKNKFCVPLSKACCLPTSRPFSVFWPCTRPTSTRSTISTTFWRGSTRVVLLLLMLRVKFMCLTVQALTWMINDVCKASTPDPSYATVPFFLAFQKGLCPICLFLMRTILRHNSSIYTSQSSVFDQGTKKGNQPTINNDNSASANISPCEWNASRSSPLSCPHFQSELPLNNCDTSTIINNMLAVSFWTAT